MLGRPLWDRTALSSFIPGYESSPRSAVTREELDPYYSRVPHPYRGGIVRDERHAHPLCHPFESGPKYMRRALFPKGRITELRVCVPIDGPS